MAAYTHGVAVEHYLGSRVGVLGRIYALSLRRFVKLANWSFRDGSSVL